MYSGERAKISYLDVRQPCERPLMLAHGKKKSQKDVAALEEGGVFLPSGLIYRLKQFVLTRGAARPFPRTWPALAMNNRRAHMSAPVPDRRVRRCVSDRER